jgi:hypothetical protein
LRGEVKAALSAEIGRRKSDPGEVPKSVSARGSGLEIVAPEFGDLRIAVQKLQQEFATMDTDSKRLTREVESLQAVVEICYQKGLNHVEIPLKDAKSLDGMISHLTKQHGGNVQEKGIVTITSKSIFKNKDDPRYAARNVADLTSDSRFLSDKAPGEWIRWDFGARRVRPTHYTMKGVLLKSWVVEGSVDGKSWTEIDRKTDNQDFKGDGNKVSFDVSKSAEFRLIRLTQTDKNHGGVDSLCLRAVEFFGTLSE